MKKIKNITPVILCGGSGTRLWPVSRKDYPKQFAHLMGDNSLFQESLLRLDKVFDEKPLIITSNGMKFIAAHQMQALNIDGHIIAEPSAQNSGPAILLSCFYIQKHCEHKIAAIFASDHVIDGADAFYQSVFNAKQAAEAGYITTFGIKPTSPSEAYGYIHAEEDIPSLDAKKIKAFVEKPDRATAQNYLDKGYLWNSGNFVFDVDILTEEYKKQDSLTVDIVQNAFSFAKIDIGMTVPDTAYSEAKDLSIDFSVMENTQKAAVISADFIWSDAGTWKSLYELCDKDVDNNAFFGQDVYFENTKNSYIHNQTDKMVVMSSLDDVSVMVTPDVIYVSPKENSKEVKNIIARLETENKPQVTTSSRVYRPWGWYETVSSGNGYQAKRITVYPGAALSLQKHFHRAEHWVVVVGTAEIVNGDQILHLQENQSTYIPKEAVHRLKNIGDNDLQLIEVQSGSYLGEDDIVRLEDVYNRH